MRAKPILAALAVALALVVTALAIWFVRMPGPPTGYDAFMIQRKAAWDRAGQPTRIRKYVAQREKPGATKVSRNISLVAAQLAPPRLLGTFGPLGYRLLKPLGSEFIVPATPETRSTDPMDWERIDIEAGLREAVAHAREVDASPGRPAVRVAADENPDLAALDREIDRIEKELYGGELDVSGTNRHWPSSSAEAYATARAARWPIFRAVVRGDRAKAGEYLERWLAIELDLHHADYGHDESHSMFEALAFLSMISSQPGFPTEALPKLQQTCEEALLTREQESQLDDLWHLRSYIEAGMKYTRQGEKRGFSGAVEILFFGHAFMAEMQRYTMARMKEDEAGAVAARKGAEKYWRLARTPADLFDYLDGRAIVRPAAAARSLRYNFPIENAIVLFAMLRYRADKGELPAVGSDLVPGYLTADFLRESHSAWRFTTDADGPVIVRFDPEWVHAPLPGGGCLALDPAGLATADAARVDTVATSPQKILCTVVRNGWPANAPAALALLWAPENAP